MIVIVDFGSQTAHLIKRRLTDIGVESIIVEPKKTYKLLQKEKPEGIILSGGPSSVYEANAPTIDKKIFSLNIPLLGICYGMQLTAHLLPKGETKKDTKREDGPATLYIDKQSPLFENIPNASQIWMSHGDTVTKPPAGFNFIAHSQSIPSAAMQDLRRKIFGVQFHPEVSHTVYGKVILRNFIEKICSITPRKKSISLPKIITSIKKIVGNNRAIAAVSGGVDSTVAAALVSKAIGKNLTVVYCDNGLMRQGTRKNVEYIFKKAVPANLIIIPCKQLFLSKLRKCTDPELKRKIIGNLYIKLFEKEAKKIKGVKFLVQGTIYSDVIESKGTKHADKIKSHHNVAGLPKKINLTLLEPLREFYKDEVRKIGRKLGLSHEILYTQPFPGPGHAIRIIGEVTKERLKKQQLADKIVLEEIKKAGLYEKIFQSFTIMTGVKSTAVRGDGRFYGEVVALRIYDSLDIMSASVSRIEYDILQRIASRITNEVKGISRVVYDITTKPPATMEWE